MSYFVNPNASISDITGALNYALANLGGSVSSNLASGQISSGGNTIGYLYQYMDVAFATSFDGVTNFSTTSFTNATYFGLRNTSSTTVSTNPADYVWYQVAGGFGTTKYLWYNVTGGRNIQFAVQATAPAGYYVQWNTDPINLDIVTSTIGVKNNILIIYQWTNGTVPARPTTTSTYTWATNTFTPVPAGWYSSLPSNTTPGDVLFEIQIPVSVSGSVLTSLLDWTNTSYPIIATSANGITGVTGTRTAVITMYQWANTTPTVFPTGTSTYTWATGVYTSASTPNGWTITPGTSIAGDILYACDAIYADNLTTSTSTITWSTSSAYSVGAAGVNGTRTAVITMYQWASSVPTVFPSGTSTYTWATGVYTAATTSNGWTITPGASVAGDILYACDAIYADSLTTPTSTITWYTSSAYSLGSSGVNGQRTAVAQLYQWSPSIPTVFPSGTSVYTWSTGTFTFSGSLNGWSTTPSAPVPGDFLYAIDEVVTDNATSTTTTFTWTTSYAYSIGASGVNGQRTAVAQLYQWASSAPSSYPSGSVTYTWATGTFTFSGSLNGWSITPTSPVPGDILYAIDQIVTDNATTLTTTVTWGSTTEYAIGLAGTNGSAGSNGLSAIYGYLVQNQTLAAPSFTTPTTGASLPSGWSATPPTVSVGYTFWYIFGQYNSSSITINGIAPNTTAWTGPTAASVFEDIVSDNWSVGGVPYATPTYGNPATYSSTGYYISRNTGDVYFNNGLFRGNVQTGSPAPVIDSTNHTISSGSGSLINSNGTFALGNTTRNIVDDGTGVYLNGFIASNYNNVSSVNLGVNDGSFHTLLTFTLTQTSTIIVGTNGYIQMSFQQSTSFTAPQHGEMNVDIQLLNSSNVNVIPGGAYYNLQWTWNNLGFTYIGSPIFIYRYACNQPISYMESITLPADTYTLQIEGSGAFYNSSGVQYAGANPIPTATFNHAATMTSYWYSVNA
jgi:hypothetical protein